MLWDPEVESPASIAVIGAGPVGIEAALYARFLGYNVDIYDAGRPARAATRWHHRSIEATVAECTTSLGHAALAAQDESYRRPDPGTVFTGKQYAEEYLTPVAKTDLLHDFVHINSPVIEVGRYRSTLDSLPPFAPSSGTTVALNEPETLADVLQSRANDEFRLVVQSRDRGVYTARADIVLDCRGFDKGLSGWGPGGAQAVGTASVQEFVHIWLPGDARFESRLLEYKQTLLFGQSDQAKRFASEWIEVAGACPQALKLIWIIPSASDQADTAVLQLAEELQKKAGSSQSFAFVFTLGIDRIQRTEAGLWRLTLLQPDDSTVELTGDVFAPFPNPRPTPSIGPELLPQQPLPPLAPFAERATGVEGLPSEPTAASDIFYPDYPGWRVATQEPHYYLLGSTVEPHRASGLSEAYNRIRDLFALLGTRRDLDLYQHFDRQA